MEANASIPQLTPSGETLANSLGKTETLEYMTFNFDKKLFLYLCFTFILMTVIGTVSHEFGHFVVAKILGFNSRINYASTMLINNPNKLMSGKEYFLFTLGGPIQTTLTGTIGTLLLYVFRKSYKIEKLSLIQWVYIFTSLFWLRQSANLFTWFLFYWIEGKFSERGDEISLARYLNLPNWSIILPTAFVGALVLIIIVIKYIPKKVRLTFLLSGLFGGISGYILWLEIIGKILMP